MIAQVHITGIIGQDVFLKDVLRQLASYSKYDSIEVIIDTPGGEVSEGMAIYSFLRKSGKSITTVAKRAWSIGSIIFCAGDRRIVENTTEPILIHNPWGSISGNSADFADMAKSLKGIENDFVKFYSTIIKADEDSIRRLLDQETFLSADEALALGFATEIKGAVKAVAFLDNDITKESIMSKATKLLQALKNFVAPQALILQDATGAEVNFPELAEDAIPAVGDIAEMNGSPAEGEIVMPDGSTFVFEGGQLMEIIPAEAESEETTEDESADIEMLIKQMFEKAKADALAEAKAERDAEINSMKALYSKQLEDLNGEIVALKKLIGSEDFSNQKRNQNSKTASNGLAQTLRNK